MAAKLLMASFMELGALCSLLLGLNDTNGLSVSCECTASVTEGTKGNIKVNHGQLRPKNTPNATLTISNLKSSKIHSVLVGRCGSAEQFGSQGK